MYHYLYLCVGIVKQRFYNTKSCFAFELNVSEYKIILLMKLEEILLCVGSKFNI